MGHVVGDVREDRRIHEVAVLEALRLPRTARLELRALGDAGLDQSLDPVVLRLRDDRSDPRGLVLRVSDDDLLGRGACDRCGFIHSGRRDEHPRRGVARLAGVVAHRTDVAGDRRREIGIVEDDVRGLAPERLRHPLDRRRRHACNFDARTGRAGERHHVDVGMRRQRGSDPGGRRH